MDQGVVDVFFNLFREGWKFIFITGRPFQWGYRTLQVLPFPYALAVQNGAILLRMPEKAVLVRSYLSPEILPLLEKISAKEKTDFVIYAGIDHEDLCLFRPHAFSPDLLTYIMQRKEALLEYYQPVEAFSDLPLRSFSSVKFFAARDQAIRIGHELEQVIGLHAPCNRDPFDPNYYVVQGTHADATKGGVLKHYMRLEGESAPIIAAGDDLNDASMLREAHVKIVMENAPDEMLRTADIIAPHSSQNGIIEGLLKAVHLVNRRDHDE
jgi:hypothetical protein